MAYFLFTNFGVFPKDLSERDEDEKILMLAMLDRLQKNMKR